MKTLNKDLGDFSHYHREKNNDKYVRNKCGRDFLYYGLNFYFPEKFNTVNINPAEIESSNLFGLRINTLFAFTQLQFIFLPKFLKKNNLELRINNVDIKNFFSLLYATIFSRIKIEDVHKKATDNIDKNIVVGIDIPVKFKGLLDHVFFIYGYDEENYYIIDTREFPYFNYERISNGFFYMKIPKVEIDKHWNTFGRVWELKIKT